MILNKIDINVYCESLKKMNVFRDGELISIDSDFEIFGPTGNKSQSYSLQVKNFSIKKFKILKLSGISQI